MRPLPSPDVGEAAQKMQNSAHLVRLERNPDFEPAAQKELPVLYRVAKRLTKDDDDAQDLVQQTLVSAYRGWKSFDGTYLRSWLIRIMRNQHASNYRTAATRPVTEELGAEMPHGEDVWSAIHWRAEAHRIREEMENLPEEFRLTLHLCDVEELNYEEVAAAMEVPLGTVKSRLSRARFLLRARLAKSENAVWA